MYVANIIIFKLPCGPIDPDGPMDKKFLNHVAIAMQYLYSIHTYFHIFNHCTFVQPIGFTSCLV